MFNTSTQRVLDYLQAYFAEHGYGPLLREIIEETGYCLDTVRTALDTLEIQRCIERKPRVNRQVARLVGYERVPLRGLPELPPLVGLKGRSAQ